MSQLDLLEKTGIPDQIEISDAKLMLLKDKKAAITLCINISCLDPKKIYGPLDIDQTQFSRMHSGQINFPHEKEDQLMTVCGNEIPLRYAALLRGKKLVPIQTSLQEKVEILKDKLAESEREKNLLVSVLQRRN